MKSCIILAFVFFTFGVVFGQNTAEDYINEGIAYHDSGNFDKAIESYKKALEIEPNSTLANYEMSYSYFKMEDYENSIKYADRVIEQQADNLLAAYISKGSALDLLGKTDESIELFEKAIKETGGHYLLSYNLGLNYYNIDKLDEAEKNLIQAIKQNLNHASSHLLLANINNRQSNVIPTLLPAYYFLLMEPNSVRSPETLTLIKAKIGGNVSRNEKDKAQIDILVSGLNGSEFRGAEIMLGLMGASNLTEENNDKSEEELFADNTRSLFKMLGELNEDDKEGIWWEFYIPFFYRLAKSEYLETYCKYIGQSDSEDAQKWVSENSDKITELANWLNKP